MTTQNASGRGSNSSDKKSAKSSTKQAPKSNNFTQAERKKGGQNSHKGY